MRAKSAVPVLSLLASAALVLGCGGGDDSSADGDNGSASAETVKIVDFKYEPADLTVPAGTTVRFVNEDSAAHTATSKESGAFDTGGFDRGRSAEITLEKAGTFDYICAFHPFMKGTISVE